MRKTLLFLTALLFAFCDNSQKFLTTESAVEYCFVIKNSDAFNSNPGDVWNLQLTYYNSADSLLFDSREVADDFTMKAPKDSLSGSIEDGIFLMHQGDSAIFRVDAKTFYEKSRKMSVPDFIKPNEKLTFYVKLKNIISAADYQKQIEEWIEKSEAQETLIIHDYINRESLNATKLESGIYKVLVKSGVGKSPSPNDLVTVNYIGSFVDGREFDNTYSCNKPFTFKLGEHKVVPGFESAVLSMKKGEKSTFIIPSKFAYGPNGVKGAIPGFATLIFYVELTEIK